MIEKKSFDRLDDAIDRTVRDMTDVAPDDRAVARVMARVREARADDGKRWVLMPRVAVACGALAFLLMAIMSWHSWHRFPARELPPLAVREFPTRVMPTPSITQAAAALARITRDRVVTPASIANGRADASESERERSAAVDMPPFESDIAVASITPAPLAEAAAIPLEPLTTSSLQVDEIPVASIDMPPVSPERRE